MELHEKIEAVRQMVKQFIPEILDPKFGCVVVDEQTADEMIFVEHRSQGEVICLDIPSHSIKTKKVSDLEVKGRSVRLADMLLAVKRYRTRDSEDGYTTELTALICDLWTWEHDDLRNQNDFTLDYFMQLFDI